jgi:hypothetical protein
VKWRLVIRPRAETDLHKAQDGYERQRAGLGTELLADIDATIQSLIRDPRLHPVYYRGFRRVLARRFPTNYSTDWKATGSLCFAFYTCAVITLGFFDPGNRDYCAVHAAIRGSTSGGE